MSLQYIRSSSGFLCKILDESLMSLECNFGRAGTFRRVYLPFFPNCGNWLSLWFPGVPKPWKLHCNPTENMIITFNMQNHAQTLRFHPISSACFELIWNGLFQGYIMNMQISCCWPSLAISTPQRKWVQTKWYNHTTLTPSQT